MARITNDMRLEALRKAPLHVQDMYGSMDTTQLIKMLRKEYNIQNDDFVDLVGDIMLGFYPKSDFRKLLQGLIGVSEEAAIAIEKDLGTLLFKIDGVPVVPVAPKDVREELTLRPASAPADVPKNTGSVLGGNRPLTREEVLRAITPKRTMAEDIEAVRQEKSGTQGTFTDSR